MRYAEPQNAWCLLNTPGFTRYDGSWSGTNLKSALDSLARLQARASRDLADPSDRFFLSRDSAEWLAQLDGALLSSI